jgi:nhaP-type Na+/H+ and K+/H+ antiporter
MRDFFQLVQTISFNVRKTARKEPIALPSRVTQVRRSTYKLEDNIGPVILIAVGVGAAFIPGMAEAQLSPTIVLTIFLPFLLYWESLSVSLVRMKRVLRGVILSATILVIITAGIIAGVGTSGAWFPLSVDALWAAPTHELRRATTIWLTQVFMEPI